MELDTTAVMEMYERWSPDVLREKLRQARNERANCERQAVSWTNEIEMLGNALWRVEHGNETPPPDLNDEPVPF